MQLHHVLICTVDLEAMRLFFEQAICLEQGPRPPFSLTVYGFTVKGNRSFTLQLRAAMAQMALLIILRSAVMTIKV
ncbi:MAG: hypothetical protein GQ559_11930 [Desulfobulbaceae bacterium]|nr:hypothetical protein [Desulfobulbaceae bacterium]